jgi:predicted Zn finger-like uncharacterized protein
MIEITCPFCDQPCSVAASDLVAEHMVVRCEECSTTTEVVDAAPTTMALALAA